MFYGAFHMCPTNIKWCHDRLDIGGFDNEELVMADTQAGGTETKRAEETHKFAISNPLPPHNLSLRCKNGARGVKILFSKLYLFAQLCTAMFISSRLTNSIPNNFEGPPNGSTIEMFMNSFLLTSNVTELAAPQRWMAS